MDDRMGWFVLVLVLAWAGNLIYQGYKRETAPPLPMADNGMGMKEPVCPACRARLVAVSRVSRGALAALVGWTLIVVGVLALIAVSWLAGLLVMLVGVVVLIAGKSNETVLMCPACGVDVRRLD